MLLKFKSLIFLIPLLCHVHAASLAAAEGDCASCGGVLTSDTGVASTNLDTIEKVSRAVAQVSLTEGQQNVLCEKFCRDGIGALKEKAEFYGYELHQIYDHVKCDDETQADLLKYRTRMASGRADLMSFARYYIREHNDAEGLTRILNTVIDNPGKPRGTLLDFIDFYADNPLHTEQERIDFAAYEVTIRRFGGKRESEL